MVSKHDLTGDSSFLSILSIGLPRDLLGRLYLFVAILILDDLLVIGVVSVESRIYSRLLSIAIITFAVFLGLGHTWLKNQRENIRFAFIFLYGYLACLAAGAYIHSLKEFQSGVAPFDPAVHRIVIGLFLLRIPLLALACVPLRKWFEMFRATSPLWLYAGITGFAARLVAHPFQNLWYQRNGDPGGFVQNATFYSVQTILHWLLPDASFNATAFTIETPHYAILIESTCSGMEGLGLVLVFTSVWLWYIRKEIRPLRGLLLIPCALAGIWMLNIVRLSALFLIGNSGRDEIANVGFHSQFGWIAFSAVALAFSVATRKLSWVQRLSTAASSAPGIQPSVNLSEVACTPPLRGDYHGESPAIRAYLVPFLAILAATSVSKAASGYFEWLYPLRFIAAVLALCFYWPELKKLNWRFGWIAPLIGAAVFLLWITPSWWTHPPAANVPSVLGAALTALSPAARWSWIAFRIAAAVVTVPIAEELAFRGFLARRLMNWDFRSISFTALTALSIGLSSAVFGLEHMKNLLDWQHLLLGFLAGCAFALALRWRGRIGDAVAAHATSNLLLAAWVLLSGDWAQW